MNIVRDVRFGCDYVDDNDVLHVGGNGELMVKTQAQLALVSDYYGPGMLAHTAGYQHVYELDIDGEWQTVK